MFKKLCFLLISMVLLTSCSALHKTVTYRNLDVQTKMSDTIFLEPVGEEEKSILVQMRNTTDKQDIHIQEEITQAFASKGYKIVTDKNKAYFIVQANVLKLERTRGENPIDLLKGGYGGALEGASVGLLAAGIHSPSHGGALGLGALLGGTVGVIADSAVEVVTYVLVTDVQISERISAFDSVEKGGMAWKKHQTRVVSTAQKVNLTYEKALPDLKLGLINSLSGLF